MVGAKGIVGVCSVDGQETAAVVVPILSCHSSISPNDAGTNACLERVFLSDSKYQVGGRATVRISQRAPYT